MKDKKGFCKTGLKPVVYSWLAHRGEEPPIAGSKGSGTIFFSNCNMRCVYCQNYEFSQCSEGKEVEIEELADIMLKLQDRKCHNINLVTPTHIMPRILKALSIAASRGLDIPIIYNTSGYELPRIIRLLEGIVDIYLPDMRYASSHAAIKYSQAPDYPSLNQESVKEMHRQTGIAQIDSSGIIEKGLIIRHLVMPNNISGTADILNFIAKEISKDTYISLMSQYFPCYKTGEFAELGRRVTQEEYAEAISHMQDCGLHNGWIQESGGLERFAGVNIKPSS
ncbi:MAG: radical SAM protein [Candidatus Omnitrophica bacterium]|nr:radical SAM protein [Candidatus Omnitrophota bacterium]